MFSLWCLAVHRQVEIDDGVYIAAFVQALAEQVRGRRGRRVCGPRLHQILWSMFKTSWVVDLIGDQNSGMPTDFSETAFLQSNLIALDPFDLPVRQPA